MRPIGRGIAGRIAARIGSRLSELGIRGTARWLLYQAEWRLREWRLGIETRKWVTMEELASPEHTVGYEPIDYRCFDNVLDHIDRRAGDSVLLDYGCGSMPYKPVFAERVDEYHGADLPTNDCAREYSDSDGPGPDCGRGRRSFCRPG